MGIPRLLGLCLAVFFIPALDGVAYATGVSTTVNPTTGYYQVNSQTYNTPSGTRTVPAQYTAQVQRVPSGFHQTAGAGLEITGMQQRTPISVKFKTGMGAIRGGAKALFSRGNLAVTGGALGIQALLNGVGWIIDDGGKVSKKGETTYPEIEDCPDCTYGLGRQFGTSEGCNEGSEHEACVYDSGSYIYYCSRSNAGHELVGYAKNPLRCVFSSTMPPPEPSYIPVPPDEIDDAVDNYYEPDTTDYPFLTPHMTPTTVEITSAPRLSAPPKTTTIYDADGNPVSIKDTNIWYDFDVKNNDTEKPEIEATRTEKTEEYENGQKTSTTEKTEKLPGTEAGGGGSVPIPSDVEIPTDCDFHPTICAWIDWTKQDDLGEEPDLSSIMYDEEIQVETFTLTGGSKACPAPYPLHLAFIGKTYELSFDAACEFAGYLYYLVMLGAYVIAGYITLGVIRNG